MNGTERSTIQKKTVDITVDGHKIKISFANEHNPSIAQLVKDTLIDSFIRNAGAYTERPVITNERA